MSLGYLLHPVNRVGMEKNEGLPTQRLEFLPAPLTFQ